MKSLSLMVSADQTANANQLLAALGRGPDSFGVACSPAGMFPATHFGNHTYDDELLGIVASKALPENIVWADFGLDENSAQQTLDAIHYRAIDNSNSVSNFAELATANGVQIIAGGE